MSGFKAPNAKRPSTRAARLAALGRKEYHQKKAGGEHRGELSSKVLSEAVAESPCPQLSSDSDNEDQYEQFRSVFDHQIQASTPMKNGNASNSSAQRTLRDLTPAPPASRMKPIIMKDLSVVSPPRKILKQHLEEPGTVVGLNKCERLASASNAKRKLDLSKTTELTEPSFRCTAGNLSTAGCTAGNLSTDGSTAGILSTAGSIAGTLSSAGSTACNLSADGSTDGNLSTTGSITGNLSSAGSTAGNLSSAGSTARNLSSALDMLSSYLSEDSQSSQPCTQSDVNNNSNASFSGLAGKGVPGIERENLSSSIKISSSVQDEDARFDETVSFNLSALNKSLDDSVLPLTADKILDDSVHTSVEATSNNFFFEQEDTTQSESAFDMSSLNKSLNESFSSFSDEPASSVNSISDDSVGTLRTSTESRVISDQETTSSATDAPSRVKELQVSPQSSRICLAPDISSHKTSTPSDNGPSSSTSSVRTGVMSEKGADSFQQLISLEPVDGDEPVFVCEENVLVIDIDPSTGDLVLPSKEININDGTLIEAVPIDEIEHPENLAENIPGELNENGGIIETEEDDPYPKPRISKPSTWKKNLVKRQSDAGLAHVSLRGKERQARTMGKGCSDKCKRKCHHKLNEESRKKIFESFWKIQNHTMQWYFLSKHVRSSPVKKRTVPLIHGTVPFRQNSNSYYLLNNGEEVQVCQKFFLETLAISEKWVRTALLKQRGNNGAVLEDKRGKVKKRSVVQTIIRNDVMNHIRKYPTVEGHYTRKDSKSRYLPEHLNRTRMHSQYLIEKQAAQQTENVATLRQYRDVFKKEFKLKFFRPKKDQCGRCLSWKNKTARERTEEARAKFRKHISDKKVSQNLKTQDIERTKTLPPDNIECVATYDLEKTLLCPKGENSEFFYASRLSVHNFTIFVSGTQQGYCFIWDQTEAGRGADEFASCVWQFINIMVDMGKKVFIFYSDNCSAQNKNQFLFSMYVMASIKFNVSITHRYLEVGHTHMEVDSIHARIESSTKNKELFVPKDWVNAIKLAKKTLPRYIVKEVKNEDILNFKLIAEHMKWASVKTSQIKEIFIEGANPGLVKYKTEYEQPSVSINVVKKPAAGRPVNWKTKELTKKYTAKIPVRPNQLKDLQSLCRSGAIPSIHHKYYLETLPALMHSAVEPDPPEELSEVELSEFSESEDSSEDDETEDDASQGTSLVDSDGDLDYEP